MDYTEYKSDEYITILLNGNHLSGQITADIKTCYISTLYISENLRRKGYGGKMLQLLESKLKDCGCECVSLTPIHNSNVFYKKNGYKYTCFGFGSTMRKYLY